MLKTREEIENYMERFGGMDNWTINEKGEVDVPGNIKLLRSFFPEGQFPFQFGKISGTFDCSGAGISSLVGAPHTVEGTFDCKSNSLKSLTGAPRIAAGFDCQRNPLTSLGNIETQIESVFLGPSLPEFSHISPDLSYSLNMLANNELRISAEDFNSKVQELKRIREEKALLESSVAKLCDTPQIGSSPVSKPTEATELTTIAPKRKFKI